MSPDWVPIGHVQSQHTVKNLKSLLITVAIIRQALWPVDQALAVHLRALKRPRLKLNESNHYNRQLNVQMRAQRVREIAN